MAPVSRVAPIDKVSLAFTIVLAAVFLGEQVSWKLGVGVVHRLEVIAAIARGPQITACGVVTITMLGP